MYLQQKRTNIYSEEIEYGTVDLGTKSQKREHMPNGEIIAVLSISKDMWEFTLKILTYGKFVQMKVEIEHGYITLQ